MNIKQFQRFGNINVNWSDKFDLTMAVAPRAKLVLPSARLRTPSFLILIAVDTSCKRLRVRGFKDGETIWDTEVWVVLVSTFRQQQNTQLVVTGAKAFHIEVENLTNDEGEVGVSWFIGELPEIDVVSRLGDL